MSASPSQRLLAELGVVRYRLRTPVATGAPETAPAVIAGAAGDSRNGSDVDSSVRLHLCAPPPSAWPAPAQAVWTQVLAWLGVSERALCWLPMGDAGGLALPEPAQWADAAGKRALWQALKGVAMDLAGARNPASDSGGHHGRGID